MVLDMSGQVCFVTGSSRAIGWACAQLFAERGADVVINARSYQNSP